MADADILELEQVALDAVAVARRLHLDGLRRRVSPNRSETDLILEIERRVTAEVTELVRSRRPYDVMSGEDPGGRGGGHFTWVIDPLDGTANYLRGSPEFCVSIGVERDRHPVVGVVCQSLTGTTWRTMSGYALRDEQKIEVSTRTSLADTIWATTFARTAAHRARQLDVFTRVLASIRDVRRSGSPALDMCRVADGTVDGFWEIGLGRWDHSAGRALVEAAGGTAVLVDPFEWQGPTVVAGSPALVERMVEWLQMVATSR